MSEKEKETPIRDIFIGNLTAKAKIIEVNYSKIIFSNDIQKIFNKISNSGNFQIGQRNKLLANNDSCFYFTLCSNNIFYLVVTDKNYPEYEAFRFIDFLHEKNIYTNTNEEHSLNDYGTQLLNDSVNEFMNSTSTHEIVSAIDNDIKDIKGQMKNNLKEVLKSTDDAKELEMQSSNIKLGAMDYENNSKELKKETCLQNFKWTLILGGAVLILLVLILVPILV